MVVDFQALHYPPENVQEYPPEFSGSIFFGLKGHESSSKHPFLRGGGGSSLDLQVGHWIFKLLVFEVSLPVFFCGGGSEGPMILRVIC